MKVIVYETDGIARIIIPALSVQEALKDIPEGISHKVINRSSLPPTREYRNAWKPNGSKVDVDMPKARDIHMGRIRAARDKELLRLDIEQLRGNDVAQAKQALRDAPQNTNLDAATTPEQLSAIWPVELPEKV